MDSKKTLLFKLCELSAKLAAGTIYGSHNPLTIENIKGQVEAYSVATLLAYGKIKEIDEMQEEENIDFLERLVREAIVNGYTTGDKMLDNALSFSYNCQLN
jgi:hypothetical protein